MVWGVVWYGMGCTPLLVGGGGVYIGLEHNRFLVELWHQTHTPKLIWMKF